jgi:DNA polymerase I-like protein with 3'-5' exonuclease and polymerase domains
MGKVSFSQVIGLPIFEANKLKEKYLETNPHLSYLEMKIKDIVLERGYLISLGRRRMYVDKNTAYIGLNYTMQGGGLDLLCAAVVELYRHNITCLMFVHDEVLVSLPILKDSLRQSEIPEKIKGIMENSIKLDIPLVCDYTKGKSWGEQSA